MKGQPAESFTFEGESPAIGEAERELLRQRVEAWRKGPVAGAYREVPPRAERFTTWGGVEVPDLATQLDVRRDSSAALGLPGEYPTSTWPRAVQASSAPINPTQTARDLIRPRIP